MCPLLALTFNDTKVWEVQNVVTWFGCAKSKVKWVRRSIWSAAESEIVYLKWEDMLVLLNSMDLFSFAIKHEMEIFNNMTCKQGMLIFKT